MSLTISDQMLEQIKRAQHIAILTGKEARLDSIAAAFAMALILKQWNKKVDLITQPKTALPSFLPTLDIKANLGATRSFHLLINTQETGISELLYDIKDNILDITIIPKHGSWGPKDITFKHGQDRYDLVIAIDCHDINDCLHSSQEELDFLYRTHVINLGHRADQETWGQINLIDLTCSSTTEVIYHWIQTQKLLPIQPELATTLLAGIIARTQSFKTPKMSPRTLEAASRLIELGAEREKITHELWRNKPIATLKLWGKMLSRLEQDENSGITWTLASKEDLLFSNASKQDLSSVVDELILTSPHTKIAIIGYIENSTLELNLFTQSPHHAGKLAQIIGGDGSEQHGTLTETGTELHKVFKEKIKLLVQYLKK